MNFATLAALIPSSRASRIGLRSEEHTSELQSHRDLHSFPTRRSSDLPEGLTVAAGEIAVAANEFRHARRAHPQLARIEDRVDALRPQTVVRAVPAEPAVITDVDDAGRVAVDLR